jgi:hypothetical protein
MGSSWTSNIEQYVLLPERAEKVSGVINLAPLSVNITETLASSLARVETHPATLKAAIDPVTPITMFFPAKILAIFLSPIRYQPVPHEGTELSDRFSGISAKGRDPQP